MKTTQRMFAMTTLGALVASLALVGCDQRDTTQAGRAVDRTVATADQKAREAGRDVSQGMDRAADATRNMAQDAKQATREVAQDAKEAGQTASNKVGDAVITTTVKAELAKDSQLSALKIDVDTADGRVALHGTAPSEQAREHATSLAGSVNGVVSVDNQLAVVAKK